MVVSYEQAAWTTKMMHYTIGSLITNAFSGKDTTTIKTVILYGL